MSYNHINVDHLFYRIRDTLPSNPKFYYVVIVLKLLPIYLQIHTSGYVGSNESVRSFFKYFSISYYIQTSLGMNNILPLTVMILFINILLVSLLLLYIKKSDNIMRLDMNYGSSKNVNVSFKIYSNLIFFKYILFCQYFHEINFLPLLCNVDSIDFKKIADTELIKNFTKDNLNICTTVSLYVMSTIAVLNFMIDMIFNYILTSRFFDFNILSDFFWNCYPNFFYSYLYLESYGQIFFIFFLNYKNSDFFTYFSIYYYFLLFVYFIRYVSKKEFYTLKSSGLITIYEFYQNQCFIAHIIVLIFYYVLNENPNDSNVIFMLVLEFILALIRYMIRHKSDLNKISAIMNLPLSQLQERNIYPILTYLCTEFKLFTDLNNKFTDKSLDLFLHNYVIHLKTCENPSCVCQDFLRKHESNSITNTIKTTSMMGYNLQ
jgi:hypothetical protein